MKSSIYLCSPKKFEGAISIPMIKFNLIKDSLDLSSFDTLLFSSKQAVKFTNMLNKEWVDKKILAVGPATKEMAIKLGAKDIYYPKDYYGKELAKDILKEFKDRKILYIRPKVISFDSKTYLSQYGIDIQEEIIYETTCNNQKFDIQKNAIIVFTSPSTIDCFFKNYKWDKSYKAVVIGKTTLKNLPSNIKAYVANEPSIASCVEKAKEIA